MSHKNFRNVPVTDGVLANDVMVELHGIEQVRTFLVNVTANVVNFFVHNDDGVAPGAVNWEAVNHIDQAGELDSPTYAANPAGGTANLVAVRGRFRGFKIEQSGAGAATAILTLFND